MFRSTISTLRKALLFTFAPHNWRGHVKQVAKFEKLPGLLSAAQKSSNSDSQQGKDHYEKCLRLIRYSFGNSEYPAADIRAFKFALNKERIPLVLSQINAKLNQLNDKLIEKKIKTLKTSFYVNDNKDEQQYFEKHLRQLSTIKKDIDHTDKENQMLEKLEEPAIVTEVKLDVPTTEPPILSHCGTDNHYHDQYHGSYLKNTSKPYSVIDVTDTTQPYFLKNMKVMTLYPHSNVKYATTTLFKSNVVEGKGEISPISMIDKELFEEVESLTLTPYLHGSMFAQQAQNYTRGKTKNLVESTDCDVNAPPSQFYNFKPKKIYPALFNSSSIYGYESNGPDCAKAATNYSNNETVQIKPQILDLDEDLENPIMKVEKIRINGISSIKDVVESFPINEKELKYEEAAKSIEDELTLLQEYEVFFFKSMLPIILHRLQRTSIKNDNSDMSKSKTQEQTSLKVGDYPKIDEQEEESVIYDETSIYPYISRNSPVDMHNLSSSQKPFSKQIESTETVKRIIQTIQNMTDNNKIQPTGSSNLPSKLETMTKLVEQRETSQSQVVKQEVLEDIEKKLEINKPVEKLVLDIQMKSLSPSTAEEIQINSTEFQEFSETQTDQCLVPNSYLAPNSDKILTNISANVSPVPLIINMEILKIIQFYNRLEASNQFEADLASVTEEAKRKCPKPPPCLPPPPPVRPKPCKPKETRCPCTPMKTDPCKPKCDGCAEDLNVTSTSHTKSTVE